MSHIEEVKTELADKAIVLEVCKKLGLLGEENKKLKIWDGSNLVAEIALTDNIGLSKKDGKMYSFVGDFYYLKKSKDSFVNEFTQAYTEAKVTKELKSKRFRNSTRTVEKDGTIVLKFVRSIV